MRLATLLLGLCAGALSSAWTLDNACSQLDFTTSKTLPAQGDSAVSVVEQGHFASMSSRFSNASREIVLDIALDSVNTAIPIRDERIRKLLFQTGKTPSAKLRVSLDKPAGKLLPELPLQLTVPAVLELAGARTPLELQLLVTRSDTHLLVRSQSVLVQAGMLNLLPGLDALRKIAGLLSIAAAVPVQARLCYSP